ncbi:tRNA-Thr(GGU) m(6)t(6)A37 methyltransferase TsaA [Rhizomicrobium palustre]|uniref:tRNA-Thr(GGU) m(6)t(6)A37 methyltransferase TsaA n=1 Tax=Rhizomicrobium palustre TaxID=189966 RepID=A0A846MWI3_9PROT|nr:SAM-dependent methyltransferase [Rhizomicrobium palustre]NIK87511.1 tRNA-Thr(GGU) m(6)t(6)A37 methyltransferase TsaA [Rhizomicrobium palustre]
MDSIPITPIGYVRCARSMPEDDNWDAFPAHIELDQTLFGPEALLGLDGFSHVEVLFRFHAIAQPPETGARRPRGRADWPKVGIFAQRGKDRPNHIGATICKVVKVDGTTLHVTGLDAIDGTPVLDIKPVWSGFLPRGEFREADWAKELMARYWRE